VLAEEREEVRLDSWSRVSLERGQRRDEVDTGGKVESVRVQERKKNTNAPSIDCEQSAFSPGSSHQLHLDDSPLLVHALFSLLRRRFTSYALPRPISGPYTVPSRPNRVFLIFRRSRRTTKWLAIAP
jgi:hypothetical protein